MTTTRTPFRIPLAVLAAGALSLGFAACSDDDGDPDDIDNPVDGVDDVIETLDDGTGDSGTMPTMDTMDTGTGTATP
jgi:hypothetical protein